MALSYVTYSGGAVDGIITDFSVPYEYLEKAHVFVYLDGVLKVLTTDYTWFNSTTIKFNTAPTSGTVVHLRRTTPSDARLVDFQDAGNLTEFDLDTSDDQNFYLSQEAQDDFADNAMNLDTDDKWEASNHVMKNLAPGVADTDAVTKLQSDATQAASAASAAAAAVSEGNADAFATAALGSAVSTAADAIATAADRVVTTADKAASSASAAAALASASSAAANEVLTDADAAATAADAVTTGADAIATAADAIATGTDAANTAADSIDTAADVVTVEGIYDDFDDRYLGSKASDPALDNDGNALIGGALYWNTTTKEMNVYNIGDTTWYSMDGLSKALADTYYQPLGGVAIETFTSVGVIGPTVRTLYAYAHGLSGTPQIVQAYMECVTADQGWSVGERVTLSYHTQYLNNERGVRSSADATNANFEVGQDINQPARTIPTNAVTYTLARWKLFVSAIYWP